MAGHAVGQSGLAMSRFSCPANVLPILATYLKGFGCGVRFDSPSSGTVTHDAGRIRFWHRDGILTIAIERNEGHFPHALLIGGIRQLIEEAAE
jgi:hypothetical protein